MKLGDGRSASIDSLAPHPARSKGSTPLCLDTRRIRSLGRVRGLGMRKGLNLSLADPGIPHRWQPLAYIMSLRSAGVVHPKRRLAARECDLPHRDPDAMGPVQVHLARVGERVAIIARRRAVARATRVLGCLGTGRSGRCGHRAHSEGSLGDERPGGESRAPHSLRRYQPDQVPRVASQSVLSLRSLVGSHQTHWLGSLMRRLASGDWRLTTDAPGGN